VGEDWFEPVLNIHTPFPHSLTNFLLFAPLQISSQKTSLMQEKTLEGHLPTLVP